MMNHKKNTYVSLAIMLIIFLTSQPLLRVYSSSNQNLASPQLVGVVKSVSGSKITIMVANLQNQNQQRGFGRVNVVLTNKIQILVVNNKTQMYVRLFENGQINEIKISPKDLRPNDILYIWFSDSKKTNVSRIVLVDTYDPYRVPDQIGVIKKIESNKLTIIVVEFNRPQIQRPQNERQNNANQQKSQRSQSTKPSNGQRQGFSQRQLPIKLTSNTKVIYITKSTEILTSTFNNGQVNEKKITLKSLKVNNIVYFWFQDSNKTTAKRMVVVGTYSSK
ncbi:hypothetical protein [Anaerocellum diazotrophicum]|uniref:DUF5666 domain-containing protein n=1 Tax=Caldicellulosiruptor diazotrophicus TaxID=2806205 RepID=A0ABN6E4N8_9FIRM|nr:hypothetical protein [Caldicellulosiruptor diazotrophicus]BCS80328.1 hypothetical protein CaldiYA01_02880 [Caldicellulosiruptor diazotrophicus]